MASAFLSDQQVVALLAEEKIITANLSWHPWGRRGQRLETTVLATGSSTTLKIVAFSGPTNQSIALLYASMDIRRVCLSGNARHINSDNERFDGLHKHCYDEKDGASRDAYLPNDITEPTNMDKSFIEFLRECNIELRGSYQGHLI